MLLSAALAAQTSARRVIDFESDNVGRPPAMFSFGLTGSGRTYGKKAYFDAVRLHSWMALPLLFVGACGGPAGDTPETQSVTVSDADAPKSVLELADHGAPRGQMTLDYGKAAARVEDVTSRLQTILGL